MAFLKQQLDKIEESPILSLQYGEASPENGQPPLETMKCARSLGNKLYERHTKPFNLHTFYKVSEAKSAVERISGALRTFVEGCDLLNEVKIEDRVPLDDFMNDVKEMKQYLGYIFDNQECAFEGVSDSVRQEWERIRSQHDDLLNHLRIVRDRDIKLEKQISGEVYRARWDDAHFAVKNLTKRCDPDKLDLEEFAQFFAEVAAMASMISQYVARLYAVSRSGQLVMELGDADLMTWYRKQPGPARPSESGHCKGWGLKLKLLHQAAKGLQHVHDQKFVHRDVHTRNFVVFMQGGASIVKIVGFGLAIIRDVTGSRTVRRHQETSTEWVAPEVFEGKPHTFKSDIYSFGIVMYEVVAETWPYSKGTPPAKVLEKKRSGEEPCTIPRDCPRGLSELMKLCCSNSPGDRPESMEVVAIRLRDLAQQHSCSMDT